MFVKDNDTAGVIRGHRGEGKISNVLGQMDMHTEYKHYTLNTSNGRQTKFVDKCTYWWTDKTILPLITRLQSDVETD